MNEITLITPPPGVTLSDYSAIEDAVLETARGRWFLLEYARRQRAAETQRLSDAVDRLESAIAIMPQPAVEAPEPPVSVAPANETAAAVAEKLSDIVWTMRERGVGDQFCAELEKQIRIIRTLRVELQGAHQAVASDPAPAAIAPPAEIAPPPPQPVPAAPSQVFGDLPEPQADPRLAALARLDAMPLREKLAFFF